MAKRLIFVILIICHSCASSIQQSSKTGNVKGIVVNEEGKPVQDAKIQLYQLLDYSVGRNLKSLNTNEAGQFEFGNIAKGRLPLIIDATQYGYIKSDNYLIQCTGLEEIKYILNKRDPTATGKSIVFGIITELNGKPISGASIVAHPAFKGNSSDVNGHYTISDLSPGDYRFQNVFVGYARQNSRIYNININEV